MMRSCRSVVGAMLESAAPACRRRCGRRRRVMGRHDGGSLVIRLSAPGGCNVNRVLCVSPRGSPIDRPFVTVFEVVGNGVHGLHQAVCGGGRRGRFQFEYRWLVGRSTEASCCLFPHPLGPIGNMIRHMKTCNISRSCRSFPSSGASSLGCASSRFARCSTCSRFYSASRRPSGVIKPLASLARFWKPRFF